MQCISSAYHAQKCDHCKDEEVDGLIRLIIACSSHFTSIKFEPCAETICTNATECLFLKVISTNVRTG
jgi:hypothetical protein